MPNIIQKNTFALFLLFSLSVVCLYAQTFSGNDTFSNANTHYREGKFEQALHLYAQISEKDAQVLYNMGNCAYKLGKIGHALLYWRRAEKKWGIFGRSELWHNIALVKTQVIQSEGQQKKMMFLKTFRNAFFAYLYSLPLFSLQFIFLFLWLFLFIFLHTFYRQRHTWLIAILFILVAFFGTMLTVRFVLEHRRYGVVVEKSVPMLSGPSSTFQAIGSLDLAQEVIIDRKIDEYYKVRQAKRNGWVTCSSVQEI